MTTNAQRQAAYKERMRKAGFTQVLVWVPADSKPKVKEFARELTAEHLAKKSPQ